MNQVGGNDELIFQGHSMVWDEKGSVLATGADFAEDLIVCDTSGSSCELHAADCDQISEVIGALTLGLRDYARKCSFKQAVVGLSGGVDSALTACLAVLALGAENVLGVAMPGPFNAPESLADARELASRLGIDFEVISIEELFSTALRSLKPIFGDLPHDFTEENLQARLRGMVLMSISNKFRRLLLSTGNKSEIAVGYCTLYGDMNGGLAVLGDVPKTMVYDLAHRLNDEHGWIPGRILTRAPSAELRPNQTDQDSLPPYEILDAILAEYVEQPPVCKGDNSRRARSGNREVGGKASRTQRIQTLAGASHIADNDKSVRDRQAKSDRARIYRGLKYIFVVFC